MLFFPILGGKEMLGSKKDTLIKNGNSKDKEGGAITGGILGYQRVEQEFHEPGEHYAPTITITEKLAHFHPRMIHAPVITSTYVGATNIIHSPGAESTKKVVVDVDSTPEISGGIDYPTDINGSTREGEGDIAGMNVTSIALIAVAGAVGIIAIKTLGKAKPKIHIGGK